MTPAIVAHKRCYDQVGPFDLEFRICEDYDMWLRLAKHFTIAGTSQALVRIRVHESSTMMGDRLALCKYRLALTQKHFGAREGDPGGWQEDKRRAYAFAYLMCALRYIQDGEREEGWRYMQEAATMWPALLSRLDVLYELACGDQPRSYRGRVDLLDIESNASELLEQLAHARGCRPLPPPDAQQSFRQCLLGAGNAERSSRPLGRSPTSSAPCHHR